MGLVAKEKPSKETTQKNVNINIQWMLAVVPVRVPSRYQMELFNHLLYMKPFNYVQTNN